MGRGQNHGNGVLEINGPDATPGPLAGAQYDDVNFGCLAACHSGSLLVNDGANFNHTMAESNWTLAYGDYGSGDCDTCHSDEFRTHSSGSFESLNAHNLHVGSALIANDCTQCHAHDGISVAPSTGIHFDGKVDFASNMTVTTYTDDFGGSCGTNLCHDTDAATEWAAVSLGGDNCVDCHDTAKTAMGFDSLASATAPRG